MIAEITHEGRRYKVDLTSPLDLSLTLSNTADNPRAWYVDLPRMEPVMTDQFTGSTELGGAVNFRNIYLNPHGHGTHTECVGHISNPILHINDFLERFWFSARVVTIDPAEVVSDERYMRQGDKAILPQQVADLNPNGETTALVIRTLPNAEEKKSKTYSGSNPPYIHVDAMRSLVAQGFEHILIDLPSVDRELDEGLLESHHVFWDYPNNPQYHRTITELIYVPENVKDGLYLLNLQVAAFANDAAPSRPVLYKPMA